MHGTFPKFLIVNDSLRFSYVKYHRDLVKSHDISPTIAGGGWWLVKDDTIILYGSSDEFGYPEQDKLKKCIENEKFNLTRDMRKCTKIQYKHSLETEVIFEWNL